MKLRFARDCSDVDDFNKRSQCLAAGLSKKGIDNAKLVKYFLNSTKDTQS